MPSASGAGISWEVRIGVAHMCSRRLGRLAKWRRSRRLRLARRGRQRRRRQRGGQRARPSPRVVHRLLARIHRHLSAGADTPWAWAQRRCEVGQGSAQLCSHSAGCEVGQGSAQLYSHSAGWAGVLCGAGGARAALPQRVGVWGGAEFTVPGLSKPSPRAGPHYQLACRPSAEEERAAQEVVETAARCVLL